MDEKIQVYEITSWIKKQEPKYRLDAVRLLNLLKTTTVEETLKECYKYLEKMLLDILKTDTVKKIQELNSYIEELKIDENNENEIENYKCLKHEIILEDNNLKNPNDLNKKIRIIEFLRININEKDKILKKIN